MQSQLRLRWLLRQARAPGVLFSNQLGMTVHALRQLDLLLVTAPPSSTTSILPVVQSLCPYADGRSQANMLHALACATAEQCSPRVTLPAELRDTLHAVQVELVEAAGALTAPETVLAMEALLKLAPFVSDAGPVVHQRLLEEVQERTVALASVVERPVDLLGVTRVAVEAAMSAPITAASSASLSIQSLTSAGTASWAVAALEQVLLVVQARLSTFAKQDLIALVDVLSVRRETAPEPTLDTAVAATPSPPLASSSTGSPAAETSNHSRSSIVFLDAARFLLDDVLDRALTTVPSLSVAQLTAWLARLVNLRLTHHELQRAVVSALVAEGTSGTGFTISQLSSTLTSLATVLPLVVTSPGVLSEKEVYVRAYVQLLHLFVVKLHRRPRTDPALLNDVTGHLVAQMGDVPESALDAYLALACAADGRVDLPKAALTATNSSAQVRYFVVLSATLEKGAAVLLRCFGQLTPREQAQAAAFVFHWRLYISATVVPDGVKDAAEPSPGDAGEDAGATARLPTSIEMVSRCRVLPAEEASRKHRAVCGLVDGALSDWGAKDVVQVLNEGVTAHHKVRGAVARQTPPPTVQQDQHRQPQRDSSAKTSAPPPLSPVQQRALLDAAAAERAALVAHLTERLLGPLQDNLKEVHTAQLVRLLSSLSKMNVRTRASYNTVLLLLKGRSLSSFEQISVLGVLARHHLRSPYIVYGVIRALRQLGETLHSSQKVLVLRFLGQVGAQRLVKAPCAESLVPGAFFRADGELAQLSVLELVFCFSGLVELRQYANPTTRHILTEVSCRVSPQHGTAGVAIASQHVFHAVRSPTAMAEFIASLCRYGGPAQGVSAAMLMDALGTLQHRLTGSRSLFVDVTQLCWYWPCISLYFDPTSTLWFGCTAAPPLSKWEGAEAGSGDGVGVTFTSPEWEALTCSYAEVRLTAQQQLRRRLLDIAESPQLRPNTFLWNQLACGVRFDALPPRGSSALTRLWKNLDRRNLGPLLSNPQQLLDVMTLALHRLPEDEEDAADMLRFVRKHIASLRVQDALQVWWCASQYLSAVSSSTNAAAVGESSRRLVQSVHAAAKETTMHEEKSVREKLSVMEQRLFQSLL